MGNDNPRSGAHDELRARRERAKGAADQTVNGGDRPYIYEQPDEHTVISHAEKILAERCDTIFQRGHRLVRVIESEKPKLRFLRGGPTTIIAEILPPTLSETITSVAYVLRYDKRSEEWQHAHPSRWLVAGLLARHVWKGIRHLEGITATPVIRPDGTVLQVPGYDPATCLIYRPSEDFGSIEENPVREHARRALVELKEIVCDVPFEGEEHRSAYLAALITPAAMPAFNGPVPLIDVDGNVRGVGKSLLADTVRRVYRNGDMPRMHNPSSEDEWDKRLLALAVAGESMVLIDNVVGEFGNAILNAALTGTTYGGRELGKTKIQTDLPLRVCWWMSGNNTVLDGDTVRRTLHVRLNYKGVNPESRKDFKHPELKEWISKERARLVRAVLTVLRAWFVAGQPDMQLEPWGSYGEWSRVVRNALTWAGEIDPAKTRVKLASEGDTDAANLRNLIMGMRQAGAIGKSYKTAAKLLELSAEPAHLSSAVDDLCGLREAIAELCPTQNGRSPSAKSFGRCLMHFRERVVAIQSDGRTRRYFIDHSHNDDPNATKLWSVNEIDVS